MTVRLPPILLLAVILHTAVFPQLRLLGVSADVLLLLPIAAAIAAGPERGATVGFISGLLADCFLQTPFGLSALAFCLVGWGVGSFQSTILHATWWIPMVTAAAASAAGIVVYAGLGAVVGQDQLVSTGLVKVIVVVAAINALLAPPAVKLMRWAFPADVRSGLVLR